MSNEKLASIVKEEYVEQQDISIYDSHTGETYYVWTVYKTIRSLHI